jgi:mono/diheme cytochrome c family protein
MTVWDWLFLEPETFHPDPQKSAAWNRGAYLTQGLAHCGMCHTPKNFLGADITSQATQGYRLQGWFAPNITNDPHRGLGGWPVDQIAEYLKRGDNNTSNASGPMSETVHLSTSPLSDEDVRAIAIYLKDQPGEPAASELNATRHVSSAVGPASQETGDAAPQSNDRNRPPASASDPPSAADPKS